MPDYRKMYYTMLHASEKAIRILIDAQQACEDLYIADQKPKIKVMPLSMKKPPDPDGEE